MRVKDGDEDRNTMSEKTSCSGGLKLDTLFVCEQMAFAVLISISFHNDWGWEVLCM